MITQAGNLNIRQERIGMKSNPKEGVRAIFCLRSYTSQGGTVNTTNVATRKRDRGTMLAQWRQHSRPGTNVAWV